MSSPDYEDDFDHEIVSWIELLDSFTIATQRLSGRVRRGSGKLGSEVKAKSNQLRNLAKDRVFKNKQVERISEGVRRQVARIDKTFSSHQVISRTEKVWYSVSLLNIFFLGYMLASSPEWMHIVYTVQLAILLPIRFYTFFKKNYHYYLADLCYFVNLMSILYIWVWPNWVHLWVACYAFSFGTLSFAIITWRNSLVLHSVEKTTSTTVHILPPVVFHTINHLIDPEFRKIRFPATERVQTWHLPRSMLYTTVAYFLWQGLYHFFITWGQSDKIKAGQVTSFEFLRKSYRNTRLGRFVNGLPGPFPVVAFTMIQFGYQISTMLLCPIWYNNKRLSSLFVTFLFFAASYNGATYYIDVFGQRFHKELIKLQKEVESLAAEPVSESPSASASYVNLRRFSDSSEVSPIISPLLRARSNDSETSPMLSPLSQPARSVETSPLFYASVPNGNNTSDIPSLPRVSGADIKEYTKTFGRSDAGSEKTSPKSDAKTDSAVTTSSTTTLKTN